VVYFSSYRLKSSHYFKRQIAYLSLKSSHMNGMKINTVMFSPKNWMEVAQELSQLDRFDAQWQMLIVAYPMH
jgi:hypothetical protein